MSDFCDAIDDWSNLSPDDRFDKMATWAQEWAQEWGINPPTIVNDDAPPGNAGSGPAGYDPVTNTLYLGDDFFSNDSKFSPETVVGETAHELRHAMQWQYYGEDKPYEFPKIPAEEDAQAFGDAVRDMAKDICDEPDYFDSSPVVSEGGGDNSGWNLPAEGGPNV